MQKVVMLSGVNSRNSGGLFNSVKSLAFSLIRNSTFDISICTYDDEFSDKDRHTYDGITQHVYKLLGPRKLGLSSDLGSILQNVSPDIIHQQGIWMFYSYNAKRFMMKNKGAKHIISPRGMLDPWILKNSRWKKEIAKVLFERSNLKSADCIHALCESEYMSIRSFGLTNPVAIIPNGINIPPHFIKAKRTGQKRTLLFISRIHPKKGLGFFIDALNNINKNDSSALINWQIRIAGWSQLGHQDELIAKTKEYGLNDKIKFLGSIYGIKKESELMNADAFILPSYSEGLPMSILEAWSYKLPVIMTKDCNIPEGFSSDAAVLIDHNIESCSKVLINFFNLDDCQLEAIGDNGYKLVRDKFTWDKIGQQTIELYEWLNKETLNKPKFIKTS
jgi:glycosyltransferase involved in cell wall biosynthesis